MELNPQFKDFLANIRPTAKQAEDWRGGAKTLRQRLHYHPVLGPLVVTTFLQGSVRRSTAIRPLGEKRPDVDVVVVTNLDHTTMTPAAAMKLFEPFLERWYSGKWYPQGRSYAIELSYVDLDLVITALPSDPTTHKALERLYRSEAVLTTESLEDTQDWRLNEQWRPQDPLAQWLNERNSTLVDAPAADWRPHPLFLPDREVNRWGRTHPIAQVQWAAAKNRRCQGHYVNVVRTLKWWRLQHADVLPKYPKGYPLEHMVGAVLPDGTESMARGVVMAFEGLRDTWAWEVAQRSKPVLPDHGVPEHDVLKRLDVEDFLAFHAAVSKAAGLARRALDSTDPQESGKLWQELLGGRFPLPGPTGGDRSTGGFTPPGVPADPVRTDRFA